MGCEWEGVDQEAPVPKGLEHALFAFGELAGPIRNDLADGPAGKRPGELLLGRQIPVFVHHLEGVIDHRGAVTLDDVASHIGVADVEVRLEYDDDLLDLRGRGLGGERGFAGAQDQAKGQKE